MCRYICRCKAFFYVLTYTAMAKREDNDAAARAALAAEIELEVLETREYLGKARLDPRVLSAIRDVPRDAFVPDALRGRAYRNRPLSIGHGQTISQPYIVAVMTDALSLTPDSRVLEIGTGSGYQAAILAELAGQVFTIESVAALSERAQAVLAVLGYRNIQFRIGDGNAGWPEHAPFDAIIVTAAAPAMPPALVDQLAAGGRMVLPLGPQGGPQTLIRIDKDETGQITETALLPVAFVPLVAPG
jgi:protein-L-isoaspartate(D-aspartate) O-methyltransferase